MKKSLTRIVFLLVAVLMLVPLAACATAPAATSAAAATSAPAVAATATPAASVEATTAPATEPAATTAAPVKIMLWDKPNSDAKPVDTDMYNKTLELVAAKFSNITIDWQSLAPGVDYRQQYDKALMAGTAPTATKMFPYVDIPTRIANGTIAEITDLVNTWDLKKQPGVVWTAFDEAISTKDGKWYAIPHDAYLMGTLVNKKALTAGGGDVNALPKTWADFAAIGQKVTDPSVPRFGYELVGMDWCAWPFTPWVWSAGGEMVRKNDDGTYKIAFNEDPGIDAAMFWNQMVWQYKMTQKDVLHDWDAVGNDIKSGRAVFAWAMPNWLSQDDLAKINATLDDFAEIGIPSKDASIPMPSFSGGQVVTFNPKASKDEIKAAFDLYTYMTYDEAFNCAMWEIADKDQADDVNPCVNMSLTEKKYTYMKSIPDGLKASLLELAKGAKPEPYCGNWNDLKNALVKPLQEILLTKDISRDKVKQILDKCADELYTKYPASFKK